MSIPQDTTLRSIGAVGSVGSGVTGPTVAWSVGGARRTAPLRVVRRDASAVPRPADLPLLTSLAPVSERPDTHRSGLRAA